MYELPISSVKTIHTIPRGHGRVATPAGISHRCHKCDELVTFSLEQHYIDIHRSSIFSSGSCPSCTAKTHFIYSTPEFNSRKSSINEGKIYTYPSKSTIHKKIKIPAVISTQIIKSYDSTVDSFNSKNYIATAAGCRRTIEGIFKVFLGLDREDENSKTLFKMINETAESSEIKEPLTKLAHAIRHGGNLGAHFDPSNEPDKEMAEAMVYLLEYLITYMYVLPEKINLIHGEEVEGVTDEP